MNQCPRCASEISELDRICPRCGMPIKENSSKNIRKRLKKEKKEQKKLLKLKKKQEREKQESIQTNFENYKAKEYMTKKQAQNSLSFDIDENNEFDINTDDVEIIDKKTQDLIKKHEKETYSIKKARGEYQPEKIRWWELYKFANRAFARRKIKKEVNKAAKIKPDFIEKPKLLLLAIFLGWTGAHNFYAKNKSKGWFMVFCLVAWLGIVALAQDIAFFASIQTSIAGFFGFLLLVFWFSDTVNIAFNNFKYKKQKLSFISRLNIETRAKLGEKYIDMDLLRKPWWVRFKVWCDKKRRNFAEYRHDRRQRLIEKEKAKQAKLEQQAKIDAEIAEYEAKENEKLKQNKILNSIDIDSLNEIKELNEENKQEKPLSKKKNAKIKISTKNNKKKD